MSDTITLSSPIQAHGAELTELSLRRPTGKDVRELGFPYRMSSDGDTVLLSADVVAKYVARLAAIPPSAVDQLDPSDLNGLGWQVAGFFLSAAQTPTAS